jgi:hypothetical protein
MSLLDGTFWANIRLSALTLGTVGIATLTLSWTRQESEEVIKAREVVEDADRKDRWARIFAFAGGVACLYGMIRTASYLGTRERRDGLPLRVEDLAPTEILYSD